MQQTSRKVLRVVTAACIGLLLAWAGVGAHAAAPTHSTASQAPPWYCVDGTPMSYGISPYSQPVPGEACYHTEDAAIRSTGQQPLDFSKLGKADIPPGGSFNEAGCGISAPAGSMQAGHTYFGRCSNGLIVSVSRVAQK
ncbi:MAG: hypothetical protein ACRDFX_07315 [Chloroflexota bacterium]